MYWFKLLSRQLALSEYGNPLARLEFGGVGFGVACQKLFSDFGTKSITANKHTASGGSTVGEKRRDPFRVLLVV